MLLHEVLGIKRPSYNVMSHIIPRVHLALTNMTEKKRQKTTENTAPCSAFSIFLLSVNARSTLRIDQLAPQYISPLIIFH